MAHCRLVVLPEDCYQELANIAADRNREPVQVEAATLTDPERVTEPQVAEKRVDQVAEERVDQVAEERVDQVAEERVDQVAEERVDQVAGVDQEPAAEVEQEPAAEQDHRADYVRTHLPPAYLHQGLALYKQLQEKGLDISKSGIITIDGTSYSRYSLGHLLRAACIKGHPGPVPLRLKQWLRRNNIDFINSNKILTPQWEARYSWRDSTKTARSSAAQKPSAKKRRA
jgi:hypothetical protein